MANRFTVSTVFGIVDNFTGPADRIKRKMNEIGSSAEKASRMMKDDFKAAGMAVAGIGAAAVAAGAAVVSLSKQVAEYGDNVAKTARYLGMSSEALQEYRYVAERSGLSVSEMDKALEKLTVNLGRGEANVVDTLDRLGLTAEQLKDAGPDKSLEMIAEAMKNVTDPADRAAAAYELFGRSGVKMVNVLTEGADGINRMRNEAQELGYIMSGDALDNSETFMDTWLNMQMAFKGIVNQIGSRVMPKITALIQKVTEAIKGNGALENIINKAVKAFDFFAKVAEVTFNVLVKIFNIVEPMIPVILGVVAAIYAYNTAMAIYKAATTAAAVAAAILNGTLAVNPIMLIVIAIGALIGLTVILVKNWDKVTAALKRAWEAVRRFAAELWGGIINAFNWLVTKVGAAWDKLKGLAIFIGGPAFAPFVLLVDVLRSVVAAWGDIVSAFQDGGFISGVKALGAAILEGLLAPFQAAWDLIQRVAGGVRSLFGGGGAAGAAGAVPVSPNTQTINSTRTVTNRSEVDVNFNNAPAGTNIRSRGAGAPNIRLNTGRASARNMR